MEDLTLALVTLTSFVLLFVVAIFADRIGLDLQAAEPLPLPVEPSSSATPAQGNAHAHAAAHRTADVA